MIAAPADASPLMRLKGCQTALTIAEYFRDQGLDVLLLMDSLTRFAQAQREIALSVGEPQATKGYPPIYAYDGIVAVTNSLIISNTAPSGGGIYSGSIGSDLNVNFTDFFGNSSNHIEDGSGPIDPTTLGSSNRITNPMFVDPQNFDLHLSSGSPAIDSGAITTERRAIAFIKSSPIWKPKQKLFGESCPIETRFWPVFRDSVP